MSKNRKDRLINAEDAFRFFTEQKDEERGVFKKGKNIGLDIARSAVRNPDAIPTAKVSTAQEWISVKDSLPKLGELVITSRLNRYGKRFQDAHKYWGDLNDFVWCDITHWMPFPEAPHDE